MECLMARSVDLAKGENLENMNDATIVITNPQSINDACSLAPKLPTLRAANTTKRWNENIFGFYCTCYIHKNKWIYTEIWRTRRKSFHHSLRNHHFLHFYFSEFPKERKHFMKGREKWANFWYSLRFGTRAKTMALAFNRLSRWQNRAKASAEFFF